MPMENAIPHIEERRLDEQARLDGLKSAPERNKWGQFATPPELALSIARHARALMGKAAVRFLAMMMLQLTILCWHTRLPLNF